MTQGRFVCAACVWTCVLSNLTNVTFTRRPAGCERMKEREVNAHVVIRAVKADTEKDRREVRKCKAVDHMNCQRG